MTDHMTPQEVGQFVGGFSAQFIRGEIKAGELPAQLIWSRAGKLGRYYIKRDDAEAYRNRLHSRGKADAIQPSQTSDTAI